MYVVCLSIPNECPVLFQGMHRINYIYIYIHTYIYIYIYIKLY